MSFLDKILGRPLEEDYSDDYGGYGSSYEEEIEVQIPPEPAYSRGEEAKAREQRVVGLHNARSDRQQTLVLVEAVSIDSAWPVCDHVRSGYTVICNTERLSADVRTRFQDIISGSAYAMGGVIQKVAQFIFIFAPRATRINFDDGSFQKEELQDGTQYDIEPLRSVRSR